MRANWRTVCPDTFGVRRLAIDDSHVATAWARACWAEPTTRHGSVVATHSALRTYTRHQAERPWSCPSCSLNIAILIVWLTARDPWISTVSSCSPGASRSVSTDVLKTV